MPDFIFQSRMSAPPDVPRPGHGGHGAGPHDGLPALVHRQARHLAHQQAQEAAPQGRAGNEPSRSLKFHSLLCNSEIFADLRFQLWLQGKDYKKGGDGLRGKNVTEAYRVKDKDLKRTMK